MRRAILILALWAAPGLAQAHGLSLDLGTVFAAPQESAFRAVEGEGEGLSSVGLSGTLTLLSPGLLRVEAQLGWAALQSEANVADSLQTTLLEHSFAAGARVRWARFWFAQPYAAVRGAMAFGWFDVEPADGDTLQAFDHAFRIEPALGIEAFLPFSALGRRFPAPFERIDRPSGASRPGVGLGVEVGFRLQTAYHFEAEHAAPQDEQEAADELGRDGPDLGRLATSGLRLGVSLFGRF